LLWRLIIASLPWCDWLASVRRCFVAGYGSSEGCWSVSRWYLGYGVSGDEWGCGWLLVLVALVVLAGSWCWVLIG
jgi:hypothetical protein